MRAARVERKGLGAKEWLSIRFCGFLILVDKTVQVRVCALFIRTLGKKNKRGFFRKEYEGGGGDWDEKVIYGRTAHHESAG